MTRMDSFALFVGYVALLAAAIVVGALACTAIYAVYEKWRDHERYEAAMDLGRRIYLDATWFGAHRDAQRILQTLGIALKLYGTYQPERLREAYERGVTPDETHEPTFAEKGE